MNNKLFEFRTKNMLKQKDLAKVAGVTVSHISYIEKGERLPSLPVASKLANFFNVSIEDLFPQYKIEKVKETSNVRG